jgi:hypothetical protein
MALGNAYPAIQLDSRGQPVDSGVTLQFTDDTDQPNAGAGAASISAQTVALLLTGIPTLGNLSSVGGGNLVGGAVPTGTAGTAATSQPFVVGAMTTVVDLANLTCTYTALLGTGGDAIDLSVQVVVTDQLGTNVAATTVVGTATPSGGTFVLSISTVGATWSIVTGADLSGTGTVLASTAGGVFTVALVAAVAGD